jgi:hypothetical protein
MKITTEVTVMTEEVPEVETSTEITETSISMITIEAQDLNSGRTDPRE